MTFKQIIAFVILVPLTVVLLAFVLANRASVRLALNPFSPDESAFSFTAPFFIWIFAFLAIGTVIGSLATWLEQHKYRKAAREREQELEALRDRHQQQGQSDLPAIR